MQRRRGQGGEGAARRANVRPEHSGSAPELYSADGSRYHSQNPSLQDDMARLAVDLLGLQVGWNCRAE